MEETGVGVRSHARPPGGRFLARKPEPEVLEGGLAPARAIVLEWLRVGA